MKEIVPTLLPPNWQRVPLEGVVIRMSNGITKRQTKDRQGLAVSRIETISQGVIDFSRVGYLNNLSPSEVENYRLHGGDILFSHINSDLHLGKTAVISMNTDPLLHGMNLLLIRVDQKKVVPVFLHWLFNYYRVAGLFMSIAQHAVNQSSINQAKLKSLPVILPPLDEQREIVAEIEKQFTRLETGVAGLRRVQANLKRYRAAVLKSACEGKLVPTEAELARQEGRSYETGTQLLDRILAERRMKWSGKGKYKELAKPEAASLSPLLPEGWAWATLPQLGELNRGKSKHRPRDDVRLYGGPYPFIQTGDIRKSGGTIREHSQTYSAVGLQQSRLWPAGTLCITIAANIAETGILTYPACFPDSVVGFVFDRDQVTTRYIEFFLRTAKESLDRFAPATAQKNINLNVLQNVALPLPPVAEQQRIVAELERSLSVVGELEAVVNANLKRAARLRQSALQQAFEGKLLQ